MSRILFTVAVVACAATAQAQQPELAGAADCLNAIPASALRAVPVHVEATADAQNRPTLRSADTLSLLVAQAIRGAFGAGDSLAHATAPMHWRQLPADVRVVLRRDGSFTGSAPRDSSVNAARQLILDALVALREADVRLSWPADATTDSLVFRIGYAWPSPSEDGSVEPFRARFAVPVFHLAVPWERPLATRRLTPPRYPDDSRMTNVEGTAILEFLVDTTGRAVPGTVRDLWPSDKPPLTGDLARHYRAFVAAATRSVMEGEFTPASIAGCAVRQKAQMPFVYSLRR